MKKKLSPLEHKEQEKVFIWAKAMEKTYPELELLNGSINGVRLTIGQAVKAKKSGMKKGYPDISLPVGRGVYHGLYIELKRKTGGVVSADQEKWIKLLNSQMNIAMVCEGYEECIYEIEFYLKLKI